jgi:hypothetical protein
MHGNSGLYFSRADYPNSWIHSNTDEQRDQEKFVPPNSASQLPCRIPWCPVPEKMHRNSARTRHSSLPNAGIAGTTSTRDRNCSVFRVSSLLTHSGSCIHGRHSAIAALVDQIKQIIL